MSRMAGVIFTGQVVGVRRLDGTGGATGVVEIEFAVEDAVRGVGGGTYTLREWAGLWPAGYEPFRAGQQYLMLLHAPGAAGLSSPVGGTDGAVPIRGGGQAGPVVDLRWVATRVVQPVAYQAPAVHWMALPAHISVGGVTSEDGLDAAPQSIMAIEGGSGMQAVGVATAAASNGAAAASPSQNAAYATVLGMLRGWEKSDHAGQ
jgi:hypothetical protein